MAKINFEFAGEVIHDHKFPFYATFFKLNQKILISCKYFVTFYDDFE